MINELKFFGKLDKKEIKNTNNKEYIVFSLTQKEIKEYNGNVTKKDITIDKFQAWNATIINNLKSSNVGDEIEIVAKITSYKNDKGYINNSFQVLELEVKKTNATQSVEDEEIPF
jgi:hypothetical protein